jgi:hypothetical protein
MADWHSPEEIREFLNRNYTEMDNIRGMSIGQVGRIYRVVLTDVFHVNHTIKIDPKDIDADRERALKEKALDPIAARKEAIRAAAQTSLSIPGPKSKGREVSPAVREKAKQIIAAKRRTPQSTPGKDKDREIER